MNKLYKVELPGIGEIIADEETLEKISDILLEAAGYNNDMISWLIEKGEKFDLFYETFNSRIESHELLRDYLKEAKK